MAKKIRLLLLALIATINMAAQSSRPVSLADGEVFTDNVSLGTDTRDMDLMVKFTFNEGDNSVTVTLLSYRDLFVFREDTRYKNVVSGSKLKPERLPYVVEPVANTTFRMSKPLKGLLPTKPSKYVFHRWIEWEGLQPVPRKYTMVNDYIEQTFDIKPQRNQVTLTLRDILVMDKSEKRGQLNYEFVYWKDLNLSYDITLRRNPCFGQQKAIELSASSLQAVSQAYKQLLAKYPKPEVETEKMKSTLDKAKEALATQYPRMAVDSVCPDIAANWTAYNSYVDSIASLSRTVKKADDGALGGKKGRLRGQGGLDVKQVYAFAHQIDDAMTQYLSSNDPQQRRDLLLLCSDIERNVEKLIKMKGATTAAQLKAVKTFRAAVTYYKNIVSSSH